MNRATQSVWDLHFLDALSRKTSFLHQSHPLPKFICTLAILFCASSFPSYEIVAILPLFLLPIWAIHSSRLPFAPLLKRLVFLQPFFLLFGVVNLFPDPVLLTFWGLHLSRGTLTMISIILKGNLCVLTTLVFFAVTGIDGFAAALATLRIPPIFISVLTLTYRYLSLLFEEVASTLLAYRLRSRKSPAIAVKQWGSLTGQIFLRSYDRSQRIYQAMTLRGGQNGLIIRPQPLRIRDGILPAFVIFFCLAIRLWY